MCCKLALIIICGGNVTKIGDAEFSYLVHCYREHFCLFGCEGLHISASLEITIHLNYYDTPFLPGLHH